MKEAIKIKIGDFSRLNQVTIKTLRYYEEIGLMIPAEVDDWTGYRYYNVAQMKKMEKIRNLKRLGFSLEEIKDIIENQNASPSLEMIEQKLSSCQNEIKELIKRRQELKTIQKSIKEKGKMENYQIKTLPKIIVASHRQIIRSYQDLFDLCPKGTSKNSHFNCYCFA
jgi:Predicted transcriptional regulators